MKKYLKPQSNIQKIETSSLLDMSVSGEEYDNEQSLGKAYGDSGLMIISEDDLWYNFWFAEEEKPDNTLEQFVAKK